MQLTSVQKMYFHFDQIEWELGRGFYSLNRTVHAFNTAIRK